MSEVADNQQAPAALPMPVRFTLRNGRTGIIRGMIEDDAEELCVMFPQTHRESDFLNYIPGEFKKTIEEEKEFIREHTSKPTSMAIVAQVDGRIVGIAGAVSPEFQRFSHHAELGLVVLKEFWGQGVGRKLMDCLIDWGSNRGLRKMYLRVFDHNARGIRLYQSLGFVEEARLPQDVRRADGTYGNTIIMALYYQN